MVAQQKINDSSSLECVGTEVLPSPVAASTKNSPGSPKSRLAMLKRSSTRTKANAAANDPFRFQGNGVDFKGKFIGERDVSEARGDAMCAEAMRLAKATVKSSGSHKQRIILNISIEGLKIKDEKSGSILYNFPVSKISFIARDTTDARAFGFIFGATDSNYKFYGIKTAQTADHAVLSIRDMFQVVFEMKKKQIKEVKQKKEEQENLERESGEKNGTAGVAATGGESDGTRMDGGVAVADLLDLESELQNLEQGFNQLQNIPSMPEDDSSDNFFLAQWNANGSNNNVVTAGTGNANCNGAGDPFDDSFFNSAPPAFGVSQTNSLNSSSGSGSGGSIVNGGGLMDGGSVPTIAPANGAIHSQPIFSCTNPFAAPSQSNGGVYQHHNGNHQHQLTNGHHFTGNGSGGLDPFDTQSAHRVINAINSAHSYGFLPPPLSLQQQQSSTMVTMTPLITIPPQPSTFGSGAFGGGMSFSSNSSGASAVTNLANSGWMMVAPSAKENTAPSAFDNANGFAIFEKNSIQLGNGGDAEKRVTTLEEAFTKLVDMDQLVSTVTTASGTENGRKNPFEHIINPPKMPLNALLTHFP